MSPSFAFPFFITSHHFLFHFFQTPIFDPSFFPDLVAVPQIKDEHSLKKMSCTRPLAHSFAYMGFAGSFPFLRADTIYESFFSTFYHLRFDTMIVLLRQIQIQKHSNKKSLHCSIL